MKVRVLVPFLFSSIFSVSGFALNQGDGSAWVNDSGDNTVRSAATSDRNLASKAWMGGAPPGVHTFTSGSGTYYTHYTFRTSSATASQGDTYSNNGVTFTVNQTVSGASTIVMYGNGSPTTSGALTRVTGSGDSAIGFEMVKSPQYLRVRMVGGGAGGGGGGTVPNPGSGGGSTTFGTSLLTANGAPNPSSYYASSGGSATVSPPATGTAIQGGVGPGALFTSGGGLVGAASPFGGAGAGGWTAAGTAAVANSGSGGGGGGANGSGVTTGPGGAAGGYIDAIIPSPASSYSFSVGTGGGGGSAGTGGYSGGAGGSGFIEVTAFYD